MEAEVLTKEEKTAIDAMAKTRVRYCKYCCAPVTNGFYICETCWDRFEEPVEEDE